MCGIVGMITGYNNGFSYNEADTFKEMLFLDTLRGWDSTGVFCVSNRNNVDILKAAVPGSDFIHTEEYKEFKGEVVFSGKFVVGHNRSATRGTVKDENAHPFWVDDNIILVQNGSYNGCHKHLKDTEVDTEAIAHTIATTPDIPTALQKINSAYALVWYNVKESTLYMIRNKERPMFFANTESGGIVFASESATIKAMAERNNVTITSPVASLKPGVLVSIKMDSKEKGGFMVTSEEVDHEYRFQHGKQQHQSYTKYSKYDERDEYERLYGFNYRSGSRVDCAYQDVDYSEVNKEVSTASWNNKDSDIVYSFPDYATKHLKEFWINAMHKYDIDSINGWLADKRIHNNTRVPIELIDWKAVNNNPSCSSYHCWGVIVDTDRPVENKTEVVHWIVTKTSRDKMLEYGKVLMYIGNIGVPNIRTFWNEGINYTMICLYASDITPVNLIQYNPEKQAS